ncbi:MAG: hypothetical protein WKG32_12075 [Gemmatimonadaceae bacterium]
MTSCRSRRGPTRESGEAARRRSVVHAAFAIAVVFTVSLTSSPARAQCRTCPPASEPVGPETRHSRWRGDLTVAAANVALGGATAALFQAVRGRPIRGALARGALGGGVTYFGKRVAVSRFDGAGFLGREIAAVGGSVVRNAAEGSPALGRLMFPVGVARLYLEHPAPRDTLRRWRARLKLDLAGVVVTAYSAAHSKLRFDAASSLSTGAPVFRARSDFQPDEWRGAQMGGVIWVRGSADRGGAINERLYADPRPHAVLAHELVHVLQRDFSAAAWTVPAEGWLLARAGAGGVGRYVDLGLDVALQALLNQVVVYEMRPWEHEARWLTSGRRDY